MVSSRVFSAVVGSLPLVLLSLVLCSKPANADYQLSIGLDPSDFAGKDGGTLSAGPPMASIPIDPYEKASDAASALAAAINAKGGNATASGNEVTVKTPPGAQKGPGIIENASGFDDVSVELIKNSTPAPGLLIPMFTTPDPSEKLASTGSLSEEFASAGSFDIVGTASFSSTDTFADATLLLYNSLLSQSSSLPAGYSFELDPGNVISLVTPDAGGITVTLGSSTTSGTLPADAMSSISFTPSVPEPYSCVLLGLGLLGPIGFHWRSRMGGAKPPTGPRPRQEVS